MGHFGSFCAKVWKKPWVLKTIPSFWWALLESTGCAKKLECLKGFQKMIDFVEILSFPCWKSVFSNCFWNMKWNNYFLKKIVAGTQIDL